MAKNRFDLETQIARSFKAERNRLGWGQVRMSEELGVAQSYVSHIERAERLPSLDVLLRFAEVTGKELVVTLKERKR